MLCWTARLCRSIGACLIVSLASPLIVADDAIDFERDIRPIFSARCLKCHGADEPQADLNLTRRETTIAAGAIQPGKSTAGSLIERVTATDLAVRMPPDGPPLSAEQIHQLQRWLAAGADWPAHWAYRPLQPVEPPRLDSAALQAWCQTPVDQFIARRLENVGLQPSPIADRLTLLRRASFDLCGLPPTIAEVELFLSDPAPDAWARCVDRLLESPHYGERWARHWIDLVHFAETHGQDQDRPREHAWRYRDYLIRSFNSDKPYAQFVREQIAGDVLEPGNPEAIEATGFLAAGPWDESSLRDIREDSLDRVIGQYLDRDDIVTTVMSTFASTSVHCARCHDHKFDPISQREYYGLQAVFAGIDKANRLYDPDVQLARQRAELQARSVYLDQQWQTNPASLLTESAAVVVQAWVGAASTNAVRWRPVALTQVQSEGGATLTVDAVEHSVLASGSRPDKDVYLVDATTDLRKVTALRLEVLPHAQLPMQGPGRQDNGNLHLNEVRCFQWIDPAQHLSRELAFTSPFADFNQPNWTIAMAVDRNPNTAWGIFPQIGQAHAAVFPLEQPIESTDPVRLRMELHQIHGGGHLIGRFRLSATDSSAAELEQAATIPAEIAAILDVPEDTRSIDQQARLTHWVLKADLTRQLSALPPQQMIYAGTRHFAAEGSFRPADVPRTIHLLQRGLVTQPGEAAVAGPLTMIAELASPWTGLPTTDEGARRVALAEWLSDPRNPLVWRSIANRVWQHDLGRPLVATPNDFGQMGAAPTHPELLDWLAIYLQQHHGSLKSLHRLILSSAVYQQQSVSQPAAVAIDGDNQWLWRRNRRRLDAESYRDALLLVSETVDPTMGGPSVRQFVQSPGRHVTPNVDYQGFDPDDPSNHRRSIYRFLFRTIPDPFMEALDCPDASQLTPERNVSLTALQALATLNDKQVVRLSQRCAESLQAATPELEDQIRLVYRRLLGRPPRENELTMLTEYARQQGLANACRVLFNTNEFVFVD